MKKLIIIAATTVAASVSFAQNLNLKNYQSTLKQVVALEESGQTVQAMLLSAQSAQQISEGIGMSQKVASVDSVLQEMREEVVTSKSNASLSFRLLFLGWGSGEAHWDTARIITTNPAEVAGFNRRAEADFSSLQKDLRSYVKKNELQITYAKAFSAKSLQLALSLSADQRQQFQGVIKRTWAQNQAMTFVGAQNIAHCINTQYANRSQGAGLNIDGLFLSFKFGYEREQLAYSETKCAASARETEVSDEVLLSAKIAQLDSVSTFYFKQLGLMELNEATAPYYPTWGNVHFSNR